MKQMERVLHEKTHISANTSKILLIKEHLESINTFKEWLEPYYEVIHVNDVALAAILVRAQAWNLVIADFDLVAAQDLDIIALAKSKYPWTPVLMCSLHQKIEHTVKVVQQHADGLLFKPFNRVSFLDTILKLTAEGEEKRKQQQKVILAIGAHPDDVELGCSGTLSRHHTVGDNLNILTLSAGGSGGNSQIREQEAKLAAEMLKANLFVGDLIDTQISYGPSTIGMIEEIVKHLQPTHIYTHSQHDNHQDHRNVHLATMVACRTVLNIYCYQSPSATIDFKPNLFIGVSDHMEQKINVLEVYESQSERNKYMHPDIIRANALYWGRFANYREVEPMEIIREEYKY